MPIQIIPNGTIHKLPLDLKNALIADPSSLTAWCNVITPLARNEVIQKKIKTKK